MKVSGLIRTEFIIIGTEKKIHNYQWRLKVLPYLTEGKIKQDIHKIYTTLSTNLAQTTFKE